MRTYNQTPRNEDHLGNPQHPADREDSPHSSSRTPPADEEVGYPNEHGQQRISSDTMPPGTLALQEHEEARDRRLNGGT